nr:hypothetical protein [Tanacetum cinerariifolium]
ITRVETSTTTQNSNVEKPVRIIPDPTGIVQAAKLLKQTDIQDGGEECVIDIKNFLKNVKLDQVVAIVKSCTSNVLGDLTVTLKDLSSTIVGSIHHKVIDEGVFYKDTVLGSGSGVGGSGMLDEEEIIKLLEEEKMAKLELWVCGNVTAQEDQYKLDKEALNLALEEKTKEARAEQEWLEKCRQKQELDEEHER